MPKWITDLFDSADTIELLIYIAIGGVVLLFRGLKFLAGLGGQKSGQASQNTAQQMQARQKLALRKRGEPVFTALLAHDWPEELRQSFLRLGAQLDVLTGKDRQPGVEGISWPIGKQLELVEKIGFFENCRSGDPDYWAAIDAKITRLWTPFVQFAIERNTRIPKGLPIAVPDLPGGAALLREALPHHPILTFPFYTDELQHLEDADLDFLVAQEMGRCLWRQMPSLELRLKDLLGETPKPLLPRWNKDHSRIFFEPKAALSAWLETCFADVWTLWQLGISGMLAYADHFIDVAPEDINFAPKSVSNQRLVGSQPPVLLRLYGMQAMLSAMGERSGAISEILGRYNLDTLDFVMLSGELYTVSLDDLLLPYQNWLQALLRPDCAIFGEAPLISAPQVLPCGGSPSPLSLRSKERKSGAETAAPITSPQASQRIESKALLPSFEEFRDALILRAFLEPPKLAKRPRRSRACSL